MSKPFSIPIEAKGHGIRFFEFELMAPSGVGQESDSIAETINTIHCHFNAPISQALKDPQTKFYELKSRWEEETAVLSSIADISMHPAYQQIIGMGPAALPMIMRELIMAPQHWFWALKAISGEDPVPAEKRGRLADMAQAWLIWWAGNRFLYDTASY